MPMIPAWLSQTAFQRKVRTEFLAHVHQRAPHWRGSYSEEEDLFLLFDSRIEPEDPDKPQDVKLNPAKICLGAQGTWGLAGRRKIYEFWLAQLEQIVQDTEMNLSLETHGDQILPRLVGPEFIAQIERQTEIPQRSWGWTGLRIVYVLDRPDSVAYIIRSMTEDLGINDAELHDLALQNLRKIFDPEPILNLVDRNEGSVQMFEDGHGAVRALLIGEHLAEGQSCGVLLPDPNTLIILPPPVNDDWKPFLHMAASLPDPLLNRPLKITSHGVELPS